MSSTLVGTSRRLFSGCRSAPRACERGWELTADTGPEMPAGCRWRRLRGASGRPAKCAGWGLQSAMHALLQVGPAAAGPLRATGGRGLAAGRRRSHVVGGGCRCTVKCELEKRAMVVRALSCLLLLAPLAAAGTLHVPQDFATIQAAVDASVAGDTVVVHKGVYAEAVIVSSKSGLIIKGAGKPLIDATGFDIGLALDGCSDVEVRG